MIFLARDFRLVTAEILYRLPDHPVLLQTYVWQDMDLAPQYPSLKKFLDFWRDNLDGKLHSVRVGCGGSLHGRSGRLTHATHLASLH